MSPASLPDASSLWTIESRNNQRKFSLSSFSCSALSLEREVERVFFTSKYKQLCSLRPSIACNDANTDSTVRDPLHISCLRPIRMVITATATNPEMLNLNSQSWEVSLGGVFPCGLSSEQEFASSHQPSTSKLEPGQEQAALWKSGQWVDRPGGASVGQKHAAAAGQQLEEVWACRPGDIRMVNQRTEPAFSGNPAAGLYLRLMLLLPKVAFSAFKPTMSIFLGS